MTKRVQLPDGNFAEFPDEMSNEQMSAALQKTFGAPQPEQPKPQASILDRVIRGINDPILGAAQIADILIDPIRQKISPGASSMKDVVAAHNVGMPDGFDPAQLAGNLANPLAWLLPGGGLATQTVNQAQAKVAERLGAKVAERLGAIGAGALQGAITSTDPRLSTQEQLVQRGVGAGIGGLIGGAPGLLPTVKPEARELIDAGVQPTPGQAYGGIIGDFEQKATSIPFLGQSIEKARGRALGEWGKAVYKQQTGYKTRDEAYDAAQKLYQENVPDLVAGSRTARYTVQQAADALNDTNLSGESRKTLESTMVGFMQRIGQTDVKQLDAEIGELIRDYGKSQTAQDKLISRHLTDFQHAYRVGYSHDSLTGDELVNPAAAAVDQANRIWRGMIPLEKAASRRADEVLTPRNVEKELARQQNKNTIAAKRNPLVEAGKATLPNTVPDSGTAGRLGLGAAILGGAAYIDPVSALTAAGLGIGAYSRFGSKILTGNTPKWLHESLKKEALQMSILLGTGLNRDSTTRRLNQEQQR